MRRFGRSHNPRVAGSRCPVRTSLLDEDNVEQVRREPDPVIQLLHYGAQGDLGAPADEQLVVLWSADGFAMKAVLVLGGAPTDNSPASRTLPIDDDLSDPERPHVRLRSKQPSPRTLSLWTWVVPGFRHLPSGSGAECCSSLHS
jgi:hypothetical protein